MASYSIGGITGKYLKPKYARIGDLLGNNIPQDGFDVYLDLNTIANVLASASKFMNQLPFSEDAEKDIVFCILDVVRHWKGFVRKHDGSRIFLLVNDFEMKPMVENDILKSYLKPFSNKFQGNKYRQFVYYWDEAMKKIGVVLNYVPGTYLIKTNFIDSYIVPEILGKDRTKLVVTGSSLYTGYILQPKTLLMYSRFSRSGSSQLTDPKIICQHISKIDDEIMETFCTNKVFYNILQAIIGDFDRGIMGTTQFGITSFAQELYRAVEKHKVPKDPKSIESVLPVIDEKYHDYLKQVFPLINLDMHAKMILPSTIEKVKALMIDKLDIDGLQSITIEGMNLLELL